MATSLTLRSTKGSALTHTEMDANLTNLRTTADDALAATDTLTADKAEAAALGVGNTDQNMGSFTGTTIADNVSAKVGMQSLETAVETKANATAVGVTSAAANMGTYTGTTIPDNETAKQNLQSLETAVETKVNASAVGVASSATNMGTFTGATIPDSQTAKEVLQVLETSLERRGIVVTDTPYSAAGDGATDDSTPFQDAIDALPAAGGIIHIPGLSYVLNTEPNVGTKSVIWDIAPNAVFSGTGTGEGNFPYMNTNTAQLAVGPYIRSQSTQHSTNANGGVAAFNIEMLQPDAYGAGQSVGLYVGARSNNANASGNAWAINCLIAVDSSAAGTHQCIEVDVDTNSSGALVKGISISGGGSANPDVALEVVRLAGTWDRGVHVLNATDSVVIQPVSAGRGIVVHGVGTTAAADGNTAITARQFANNEDTILLQRHTDTTPTGNFLRAVNTANDTNIAILGIAGDLTLAGGITAGVATLSSPSSTGTDILTGKNLSNAAVTTKYINLTFSGADTVSAEKSVGGIRFDPVDSNWVDAKLTLNVRQNDGVTPGLILFGTGTPEGAVTAPPGAIFTRDDGGAGTTLYIKESGTGSAGWAAK